MRDYGGRSLGGRGVLQTALRVFFGALLLFAFLLFVLWRTENPRLQGLRLAVLDAMTPVMESIAGPSNFVSDLFDDVQSLAAIQAENERLKIENSELRFWKDRFDALEAENADLRRQLGLRAALPPRGVSARAVGDSGGPFNESLIIDVGRANGVADGVAALGASRRVADPRRDPVALIGRVVGVGETSARVLLITDAASRIPVVVGRDRRRAILVGDNTSQPRLQAFDDNSPIEEDASVSTSGQGGVFPPGLYIGRVTGVEDGVVRVGLSVDISRLQHVFVLRSGEESQSPGGGGLILDPSGSAPLGFTPAAN